MSIKQGFLALLSQRPMNGYQLRQEFEARTGGTWPLNIGQAYTTLQRLERDGLVEPVAGDDENSERFELTEAGQEEVNSWWYRPVQRGAPARDELTTKLALAVTVPGLDVSAMIAGQRTETLKALRDYTRLKRTSATAGANSPQASDQSNPATTLAWSLVLDSLIFDAEAEVRWLDHVEQELTAAAAKSSAAAAATSAPTRKPARAKSRKLVNAGVH